MILLVHRSRSVLHHRIGDLEKSGNFHDYRIALHHRIGDLEI